MYSTTQELESELNKAKSIGQLQKLQQRTEQQEAAPTPLTYLLNTAEAHGLDRKNLTKLIIQQSLLERSYVYHLLSGEYGLTRDKLLQFAIIAGFTLEESNTLLKYAHLAALYPRDTRDAALIYCFQQKLSLLETNMTLNELGHNSLE